MTTFLRELPVGSFLLEKPPVEAADESGHYRAVVIEADVFYGVDDYSRSMPTSPSAGRVYRKNLHWSGPPDNWFLYVVIDAPDGDGQLHVPYSVLHP